MTDVRILDVHGVTLSYRVAGDPAGPAMVLLHGLGDDERDWQSVLPTLAETHRVYALDLRGHGRSAHPGDYSFELMRDDVLGFLAAAGIGRCVLIGHSMGGTVAILLAQVAPHLLTHLIVEDVTAPRPGALPRPPLTPPDEPTPFDFAAVNAIRAQINDPDPAWWDGLATIEVPTLIIGGATSPIPQHLLTETAALMPDARIVTIDAGHNVHRDRPDEFLAAVAGFLTGDTDELVGLWDSALFDYGSMESSRFALYGDGSGWGLWENAAGGAELTLFHWRRLGPDVLTIVTTELVSGSWQSTRPGCVISDERSTLDESVVLRYEIVTEVPPLGTTAVPALKLDQPFQFTTDYALIRHDVARSEAPVVVASR